MADTIVMKFTRWWGYLGHLGVMEGETTEKVDKLKRVQHLSRNVKLVEKAAKIEVKEEKPR